MALPTTIAAQNQGYVQKGEISMWFQTLISDSTQEVQVVPTLLNKGKEPNFLYYSSILGDENLSIRNAAQEQKGMVALMPWDTSIIYLTFNPINIDTSQKKIRFFLRENEFVFLKSEWTSGVLFPKKEAPQATQKSTVQNKQTVGSAQQSADKQAPKTQKASTKNDKIKTQKEQSIASAQNKTSNGKQPFLAKDDFEIGGLIFNETRTRFGAEFYKTLIENWTPPQKVGSYWVTIRELPSPGRFTIISVNLNNRELFQRNLIPRGNYIQSLAYQTANTLTNILKQGNYDGSLSNGDLFGSGVE